MRSLIIILIITLICTGSMAQEVQTLRLTAHMLGEVQLHDGRTVDTWGFLFTDSIENPEAPNQLPSPTLTWEAGDSIYMIVDNGSNLPHTVHLHGMDIGQANDGVPCTSFQIEGYQTGTYRVKVKHPGTYLYHCHFETHIHLQMGMYGAVVVYPKGIPNAVYDAETRFTKEYIWLASEIDVDWHNKELTNGNQPVYTPGYFLINGKEGAQIKADPKTNLTASPGDTILIRLANMGYGINRYIFPDELGATVVGSDGRKFDVAELTDTLLVYPGERYAVMSCPVQIIKDSVRVEYLSNYQDELWGVNHVPIVVDKQSPLNTSAPRLQVQVEYVAGEVILGFSASGNRTALIHDLSGRVLKEVHSREATLHLPLQYARPGVYVVRVVARDGFWTSKILVNSK